MTPIATSGKSGRFLASSSAAFIRVEHRCINPWRYTDTKNMGRWHWVGDLALADVDVASRNGLTLRVRSGRNCPFDKMPHVADLSPALAARIVMVREMWLEAGAPLESWKAVPL